MIKVLLIDDEEMVRNGLKKFISWELLGIDEVMTAESAEIALEIVREQKPDIIISDIRMPKMNGIELCEKIKKLHSAARIVFLSGYSDKEYLKGAIHLSAEEYIEKPVNIQVMEECLQRVIAKCEKDKELYQKEQELDYFRKSKDELLQGQIVHAIINGRDEKEISVLAGKNLAETENRCRQMQLILLQLQKGDGSGKEQCERFIEEIKSQFQETKYLLYKKSDYLVILLLYFTKDEYIKNVYEEIQEFTKKISQRILQTQVFAVLSNRIENINMTPEMYQNCVILLQRLFFYGYCHVICQWEEQQSTTDFENIDIAHFRQAVWREDYDLIKKEANSLYVYLNTKVNVLPNIIKNIYFNMIYSIYEKAEKTSMSRFVQEEQDYLWEKINKLETIKECNEYLIENIDMLCNNRELLITDNKMVLKIIDYVKKNFMREEMSIKQIADSVFMSPAYLTTFFKKKTGKTIGQYIKEVRMEYAVFLLTEKGYSVCEISKFCGYSDANYFTKVFRKVYGMSPSEYKERR